MDTSASRSLRASFSPELEHRALLTERIGAELDFAAWLASRERGNAAKELASIVETARAAVAGDKGGTASLEKAVGRAEQLLDPFGARAKAFEVYCVGHAHIDMNWMWSWPETVSITIDSVQTVLTLLEEYPDFVFSQSQASIYRILERYRPDLLDRVRSFVKEGRWEVTASHWVETEKNIVNGESLCRHLLYTRAYMHELFALTPEDVPIDWSPDTFGHTETVPTYLVQGGVKYLYLHRPGAHYEQPVPRAFTWRGPDGASVLVRNDMHLAYNGVISPDLVSRSLVPMAEELGLDYTMFVYGVGDHGGGPTRRDLERVGAMREWPIFPTVTFAKAVDFYTRLEGDASKLPERRGELNFEFTGCYTTQTLIKRSNRLAEISLLEAEQAETFASLALALPDKGGLLRDAWEKTLFNHFHDILPGSGVRDTRTYAHGIFQEAAAAIATSKTHALRTIAAAVDTTPAAGDRDRLGYYESLRFGGGGGFGASETGVSAYAASPADAYPFVLCNQTASAFGSTVEAVVWDPGSHWDEATTPRKFTATGPDGEVVAAQTLETGHYWGHRFVRICFPATIPAWGYARYIVEESASDLATATPKPGEERRPNGAAQTGFAHACSYAGYERGPEGLANEHLEVDFDLATGAPSRFVERKSGIIVETPGMGLEYAVEQAGGMSAWRIHHRRETGTPRFVGIERKHSGPHMATIVSKYEINDSKFTVVWELRSGEPLLRVRIDGTWLERGDKERGIPSLVLKFPAAPREAVFTCEEPFGAIDRSFPNGEEVPAYRWAAVRGDFAGGNAACVLFNDTKHGHSYHQGVLRLTLIRSSYEPDPLPEIGRHEVTAAVGIYPLEAGTPLPVGRISAFAEGFVSPVAVVGTGVHGGSLPAAAGWMSLEPSGTAPLPVVSSIKKAEDQDGIIVRCYNPSDRRAIGTLVVSPLLGTPRSAVPVDLLERTVSDGAPVRFERGRAALDIPSRALRSYRIRIDR